MADRKQATSLLLLRNTSSACSNRMEASGESSELIEPEFDILLMDHEPPKASARPALVEKKGCPSSKLNVNRARVALLGRCAAAYCGTPRAMCGGRRLTASRC